MEIADSFIFSPAYSGCPGKEAIICVFVCLVTYFLMGGSVAEWLACWTRVQKGPGLHCSRDAVGYRAVLTNGHTWHVPRAPGFFFLFEGSKLAVVKSLW